MRTFKIHATDLSSWRTCRRSFHLAHELRLKPNTAAFAEDENDGGVDLTLPLRIGTAGHEVLSHLYSGNPQWKDEIITYSTAQGLDLESYGMLVDLLEHYSEKTKNELDDWETILVETPIEVPLGTFVDLNGENVEAVLVFTLDLLQKHKRSGVYRIQDHKFYKAFKNQIEIERDPQLLIYLWGVNRALKEDKIVVNQISLNMFRKGTINFPTPIAKGTKLSKDKAQLTTAPKYRRMVEELGFDMAEYQEFIDYLAVRDDPFHRRADVFKNIREINNIEVWLLAQIEEILCVKLTRYENPGRHCRWCRYEKACTALNQGSSIKAMLGNMLINKEDDER